MDVIYGRQATDPGQVAADWTSRMGTKGTQGEFHRQSIGIQALQHVRTIKIVSLGITDTKNRTKQKYFPWTPVAKPRA